MEPLNDFSDQFQQAAEESLKTLVDFLRSEGDDEKLMKKARVASSVLACHGRFEATKSVRERTIVGLARTLARDREQLAEYVKITLPESKIAGALPAPAKPQPEQKAKK